MFSTEPEEDPPMSVDEVRETLKTVMANTAMPVAVVSSIDGQTPCGTTVSAFVSLSMNPPMVLVSLDRASETLEVVRRTHRFGLNILGVHQASTALTFATKKGSMKFAHTRWTLDDRLPRITGVSGWVACTVAGLVEGGDHVVVMGFADAAEATDCPPLVYHRRNFNTRAAG